jgi:hypothetical protein
MVFFLGLTLSIRHRQVLLFNSLPCASCSDWTTQLFGCRRFSHQNASLNPCDGISCLGTKKLSPSLVYPRTVAHSPGNRQVVPKHFILFYPIDEYLSLPSIHGQKVSIDRDRPGGDPIEISTIDNSIYAS